MCFLPSSSIKSVRMSSISQSAASPHSSIAYKPKGYGQCKCRTNRWPTLRHQCRRASICNAVDEFLIGKLDHAEATWKELQNRMADPAISANPSELTEVAKAASDLDEVVSAYKTYKTFSSQLEEAEDILKEAADDPEMLELGEEEVSMLTPKISELEEQLRMLLLPKDPLDTKNIVLEIRAGAGGDEAAIWAGDLVRMYQKYGEMQAWNSKVMSLVVAESGGFKEAVIQVSGTDVYSKLKYEGGVHRVQRIPQTESEGRVHTSTATVAVMPEVDEVDVQIDPKNVNKVESAIDLTHKPTGIRIFCTQDRSQLKNKLLAFKILRSKLFEIEENKRRAEISETRKSQVGRGSRSEKIRTYNYKDNRMSDHRLKNNYDLAKALAGGIGVCIEDMILLDQQERLQDLTSK